MHQQLNGFFSKRQVTPYHLPTKKDKQAKHAEKSDLFHHIFTATMVNFEASLHQHMPAGPYRDFYLWAISPQNSQSSDYLQAIGLTKLIYMTATLLDGLVDNAHLPELAARTVPMNIYQIHEIVSDNLAIGLANRCQNDITYVQRHSLLQAFNTAMCKRLSRDPQSAAHLLSPVRSVTRQISGFDQSLIKNKHAKLTNAYLKQQGNVPVEELEYTLWPSLVANIETCAVLADTMQDYRLGTLLREGLIGRYQAVNTLLQGVTMARPQLSDVGASAILVMPTLAYYISVLTEIVQPLADMPFVILNGTLAEALYDAALLVRLLNDLGTTLLTLPEDEQAVMLNTLTLRYQKYTHTPPTILDFLAEAAGELDLLTRLQKDILFGEFNVGLYGLSHIDSIPDALFVFGRHLSFFSQQYAHHRARLIDTLEVIDHSLQNDIVSKLVLRFVKFHEVLYSNPHYSDTGEYAI